MTTNKTEKLKRPYNVKYQTRSITWPMPANVKTPWFKTAGNIPTTLEYFDGSMVDAVEATAKCLRQHPEVLVSLDGDQVIQRAHVNLGMAVALDAGLIVPVIRDADRLGLDALSAAAKDLASRAKNNKLTPDEYKGSTFSVSNLGMFGIETFTPIVNQPDAAILGVCAVQDELVMDDEGNISKHQVMRLSFTYDHRLIDGAVAAKFVMALRDLLEKPMSIIL